TQIYRVSEAGGSPWPSRCDGTPEKICSTFYSHCSSGDHHTCFGPEECTGAYGSCADECTTDAECPTGATCVQLDGQLDATGWPCRDQTGRGMDDPITHVQASAPLYWWNNRDEMDRPQPFGIADTDRSYIVEGCDYCSHDPTTA